MRYLDSSTRDSQSFMGSWLQDNVTPKIRSFEAQYGYFEYKALSPFQESLRLAGDAGASIHMVLGSNRRHLTDSDLHRTLDLVDGLPTATITVVAFKSGLFHPKVAVIEKAHGRFACLIGSGNLTCAGIGKNIEAFLALDTKHDQCQDIVVLIRHAIAHWRSEPLPEGAFQVRSADDIRDLRARGVICTDQERQEKEEAERQQMRIALPSLRNGWEPERPKAVPDAGYPSPHAAKAASIDPYPFVLMEGYRKRGEDLQKIGERIEVAAKQEASLICTKLTSSHPSYNGLPAVLIHVDGFRERSPRNGPGSLTIDTDRNHPQWLVLMHTLETGEEVIVARSAAPRWKPRAFCQFPDGVKLYATVDEVRRLVGD